MYTCYEHKYQSVIKPCPKCEERKPVDYSKIARQVEQAMREPDFGEEENDGDEFCPACGREYDEIDHEYQICHYCTFNNNPTD